MNKVALPAGAAIAAAVSIAIYAQSGTNPTLWMMAGNDLSNSRSQPAESRSGTSNVGSLTTKWVFQTGGDVSATPAVGPDAIYVPDWAGGLYAIRKDNGERIWAFPISQYTGAAKPYSRVTPALHGTDIIIGDIASAGT